MKEDFIDIFEPPHVFGNRQIDGQIHVISRLPPDSSLKRSVSRKTLWTLLQANNECHLENKKAITTHLVCNLLAPWKFTRSFSIPYTCVLSDVISYNKETQFAISPVTYRWQITWSEHPVILDVFPVFWQREATAACLLCMPSLRCRPSGTIRSNLAVAETLLGHCSRNKQNNNNNKTFIMRKFHKMFKCAWQD